MNIMSKAKKHDEEKPCGAVSIGGRTVKYTVVFTAKKNIILKVTGKDCVRISMPPRAHHRGLLRPALSSEKHAEKFIKENEFRVLKLLEKYDAACEASREGEDRAGFANGEKPSRVFVWGEAFTVCYETCGRKTAVAEIKCEDKLVLVKAAENCGNHEIIAAIQKALGKLLLPACRELNLLCFDSFNKAGFKSPLAAVSIKNMTSRWGSCTAAKGKISVNLKLVHFPKNCLESVFFHEYAHFTEQNHSKGFYDILDKMYPCHREASQILKKEHHVYSLLG